MIDLPIEFPVDAVSNIQFSQISEKVADLAPVIQVIRQTWSVQTLSSLKDGRVAVPDDVINDSLARYTDANSPIYNIRFTSTADQKFRLTAQTKTVGAIDFLCRIDQFVHNKDVSFLKITVLEKDLPDQEVMSWLVSRLSLSMVEKMVGKIDFGGDVKAKIVGDTIAIDFHEALQQSEFGRSNLFGYSLSNAVVIENAVPRDGYIEFKASLEMPDAVKGMLQNILSNHGNSEGKIVVN